MTQPDARKPDMVKIALLAAVGVVAAILGLTLSTLLFGPQRGDAGAIAETRGEALIGGPFELVDQTGATVTESMLDGRLSLMFFGYTFCPDFCPTELNTMSIARDMLAERGVDVQLIFVTVDPERDTPEILGEYVSAFGDGIIGLTGTEAQVAAAAQAYRVIYRRVSLPDFPGGYAMDHSTFVYAMGPDGRFMTHFSFGDSPSEIADAIAARAGV